VSELARQVDALNNLYRDELEKLRDEQEKKRDQLLANVLAIGSALGLGLAVIQSDGTGFFPQQRGPSWLTAGGLTLGFLLTYFWFYRKISGKRRPRGRQGREP
jgi:hypothetical protein